MSRTTPEWQGRTDDARPPRSVYIRLFEAARGLCQNCCGRLKPGHWHLDHKLRLKDGKGYNRENNLQALCEACHREKTGAENRQQAKANRVKAGTYGIEKRGKPFPGSKRDKWKKKINGEVVLR